MNIYEVHLTILRDIIEFDLLIEGTVTPGSPGRRFGPPELCEPEEPPEAEVTKVLYEGEVWNGKLTKDEEEQAEEFLLDAWSKDDSFNEPDEDFYEDS